VGGQRKEAPLVGNSDLLGAWQHTLLSLAWRVPESPALTLGTLVPKIKWKYPGWSALVKGENPISFI